MNFIIYGKPNCPFCTNAKILLEQREQDFKYLTLDEDYSLDQIQNLVLEKTGVLPRTFPQIFVEDGEHLTHLGGFSELREFMAQIAE